MFKKLLIIILLLAFCVSTSYAENQTEIQSFLEQQFVDLQSNEALSKYPWAIESIKQGFTDLKIEQVAQNSKFTSFRVTINIAALKFHL